MSDLDDIAAEEAMKETLEHIGETMAASTDPTAAAAGKALLKSLHTIGFANAALSDDPVGNYFVEATKGFLTIVAGGAGTAFGGPGGGIAASLGTAIALEYLDTRGDQSGAGAINIAILEDGISVSSDGTTAIEIWTDETTGNTVVDIFDPDDPEYRVQITKDSDGNVVGAVSDIGRYKIEEHPDGSVTITDKEFDTVVTVDRDDPYAQAAFNDQKQHVNNDYLPNISDAGAGASVIDGGNGVGTVMNDDIMITSDGNGNTIIDTINTFVERGSDGEIRITRIDTQTNEVSGVIIKPNGDTVCFLPSNGAGSPLDIFRGDPSTWPQSAQEACAGIITDATNDIVQGLRDLAESGLDAMSALLPHGVMETLNDLFSKVSDEQGAFGSVANWISGAWNAFMAAWNSGSPLVLDLDGDGIELVSLVNSNVYWDIDQDGFAEAIGWVQADDGFLAIDANLDGIITDHSELFGSVAEDGFTDLRMLDSNADNVINASDTAFADLLVWRDLNQNGFSEANELFSLSALNIVSINANATTVNQTNAGHDVSHVSTYTVDDGVSGPQNLAIVDVWFQYDDINSEFVDDYTLDLASLFTVNQRGYGTLPDLYIAASEDNDLNDPNSLLSLLTAFSGKTLDELLVDDGSVLAAVEAIMYRWAGVDGVDPGSRGAHVDGRKLEFLEELFGQEFLQAGWLANPGGFAGDMLDKAFDIALDALTARLIAQGAGQSLFTGGTFYNPLTDSVDGVTGLNLDTLDAVLAIAQDASKVSDKVAFWKGVVNVIDQLVGMGNLSSGDQTALNAAIAASDSTLSTALILESLEWLSEIGGSYVGTSGNDTLSGTVGNDTFAGGHGADALSGGIGNDFLNGQSGDDILNGQSGDDELLGDSGSDTYLYFAGQGHDIFRENGSGTDRILFGPGVVFSDLTFTRISNTALLIEVSNEAGGGAITIDLQFRSSDAGYIETLEFADSSSVSLNSLVYTLDGTSAGETLHGIRYGGSQNDTIYGYGGNDVIYGYHSTLDTGDNSLYGGDGDDTVYGAHGVDWMEGNAGNDYLKGWNGNDTLDGGDGDDELYGESQDDLLIGGAGADKLFGGNNNDILIGGLGADELTGNTGSDIFRFLTGQTFDAVDTIKDFNPSYDAIDLRDVLYEYDPLTEIITDFIQITTSGSNSLLAVDADGGADNFIQIAVIQGQTGMTDEAALVASGKLLVA